MADTRAAQRLEKLDIQPYQIQASNTVRKGFPVKAGTGDTIVEAAAVGDNIIGIALEAGNGDATDRYGTVGVVGHTIKVARPGPGAVPVLVGTGGATRGAPLKWVSDGVTNATVGGATTKLTVVGQAEETGVAADLIACDLSKFSFTVGS
jgi:hypothetical protein